MRGWTFLLLAVLVAAAVYAAAAAINNGYVFFAGYVVLQYVVLATAWNLLGGYTGYVNFGIAGFFALAAYTTVALEKLAPLPLPVVILAGGAVSGLLGLGSFAGTVVAAMLLGIMESLTATFYGPSWSPAVAFGFLLLALAVKPSGVFGR